MAGCAGVSAGHLFAYDQKRQAQVPGVGDSAGDALGELEVQPDCRFCQPQQLSLLGMIVEGMGDVFGVNQQLPRSIRVACRRRLRDVPQSLHPAFWIGDGAGNAGGVRRIQFGHRFCDPGQHIDLVSRVSDRASYALGIGQK